MNKKVKCIEKTHFLIIISFKIIKEYQPWIQVFKYSICDSSKIIKLLL